MRNFKNPTKNSDINSNLFLDNVMPHIKVSKKSFPLAGIEPVKNEGAFSLIPANHYSE